jgi:hypothetical protein
MTQTLSFGLQAPRAASGAAAAFTWYYFIGQAGTG